MNLIEVSDSIIELPIDIARESSIRKIIEIAPIEEQNSVPRARIFFAKAPDIQTSIQARRTSNHHLLKRLLCSISVTQNQHWKIEYLDSGAPVLASGENRDLHISLTRSGDWLAAGVSVGARIGIDIEYIKSRTNISEKANFLNWSVPVVDLRDFYAKWTLWEAAAKCAQGSVLMKRNPGFENLCRLDTRDRIARSERWIGLHDHIDDQITYSVVLQCKKFSDLGHKGLCLEQMKSWPKTNNNQPKNTY